MRFWCVLVIFAGWSFDDVVITVVSILLRMIGEIYASISVVGGVGGSLMVLFGGSGDMSIGSFLTAPGMGWQTGLFYGLLGSSGSSFLYVILLSVSGIAGALFWLTVFYFGAEVLIVQVDIARNTRSLRQEVPVDPLRQ